MVIIRGPGQVGKGTLAKGLLTEDSPDGRYLNRDSDEDRRNILKGRWSSENRLPVFDELHKYPRWKSWIKGVL